MKTSSKTLFFFMMIMSTINVISSSNWLNLWIGLEINLMSFIPMIFKAKNNLLSQASMTYFLIQSMGSSIMVISIMSTKYILFNYSLNMNSPIMMMMMFSMMMKMGMPPFHLWLQEMMSKISWDMCMLLMTWQKMAPMYIISMIMEINKLMMVMIILSAMTSSIMGLNHTSTRKIMAYSSMNHMSWMMTCALMYKKLWMMYLMIYSIMTIMLCMNMHKYNIMFINQFSVKSLKMTEKLSFFILMMSMGGMPPFLGFMPKWMTIEYMIMSNEMLLMMFLMMSSVITLSYYMRMVTSINLMMSSSQKWMILNKSSKKTLMISMYSNMMLPMAIFLMNFM